MLCRKLRVRAIGSLCCALTLFGLVAALGAAEPAAKATPRKTNRLARETSPYLLLHQHNPVDWYPWGEEALERAKREGKPIFLSIGYSSCYWCHVMERESFEDPEIARWLNEHFVCIKVDREERPDIDEIYMTSLQVLGRRGGWPLSMFLTSDAKPFFGGTYFPPRDKELPVPAGAQGDEAVPRKMTGFFTLLKLVEEKWVDAPKEISDSAEQVTGAVRRRLSHAALVKAELPAVTVLDDLIGELSLSYDKQFGGFGFSESDARRPKFPEPSNLVFLLDRARRNGDERARGMLFGTLDALAAGGIRDHLGGGFHRYSTDRYWHIPHFEKMLYDNGQLASVYAEAYALERRRDDRRVVEELLSFIEREMIDPQGGFYAALDAETDGHEGLYYAWTRDEVAKLLTADEAKLVGELYGLSGEANFEQRWVLLRKRRASAAEEPLWQSARDKLLSARNSRPRPLTDTKILVDWNGLMIRGCADAGRLLDEPRYTQLAARSARHVLDRAVDSNGRLQHTMTDGHARLNAYLDDYAFLIDGLIALHQADQDPAWLATADKLMSTQLDWFWDAAGGGFYFTSRDHEQLIARSKDPVDSALPSGNAVSAGNLVYLAQHLGRVEYLDRAEETVRAFAPLLSQAPAAVPRLAVSWAALRAAREKLKP